MEANNTNGEVAKIENTLQYTVYRLWSGDSNDRQEFGRLSVPTPKVEEFLENPLNALKQCGVLKADCDEPHHEDGDDKFFFLEWYSGPFDDNGEEINVEGYEEKYGYEPDNDDFQNEYIQVEQIENPTEADRDIKLIFGGNSRYTWGDE